MQAEKTKLSQNSMISIGLLVTIIGAVVSVSVFTGRVLERLDMVTEGQQQVVAELSELSGRVDKLADLSRDRWTRQDMRTLNRAWRQWITESAPSASYKRMPEVDDFPPSMH